MEDDRFSLGVFTCVFNKDYTKILLLLRNSDKRKFWDVDWGNVGGHIEFGETSIQAATREIMEEIGVKVDPSELRLINVKETPNFLPHIHAVHFVYALCIDESTKIVLNATAPTKESDKYEWFRIEDLPDRTFDPKDDIIKWRDLARQGSVIHSQ